MLAEDLNVISRIKEAGVRKKIREIKDLLAELGTLSEVFS